MDKSLPTALLLTLSIAACRGVEPARQSAPVAPADGAAAAADLARDELVFVWTEIGGCGVVRPDCPRYEVQADGTVRTYREGSTEVAASGTIDALTIEAWIEVSRGTDVAALLRRLGPNEEATPYDGVDYRLDAPLAGLTLSSAEKAFDVDEPFFAAALAVVRAAEEAAPLPPAKD